MGILLFAQKSKPSKPKETNGLNYSKSSLFLIPLPAHLKPLFSCRPYHHALSAILFMLMNQALY